MDTYKSSNKSAYYDDEIIHTSLVYLTSVARIKFWDSEADKKTCLYVYVLAF
jgi:hypothetical protein